MPKSSEQNCCYAGYSDFAAVAVATAVKRLIAVDDFAAAAEATIAAFEREAN